MKILKLIEAKRNLCNPVFISVIPKKMKTQSTIQKILLINDEVYFWKVVNAGIAFAEFYWAKDKELVKVITETKAFWDWWRNQFDQQNEVFINRYKAYRCDEKKLFWEWEQCLEPEAVIAYPGQYVIDAALCKLFGGFANMFNHLNNPGAIGPLKSVVCKK